MLSNPISKPLQSPPRRLRMRMLPKVSDARLIPRFDRSKHSSDHAAARLLMQVKEIAKEEARRLTLKPKRLAKRVKVNQVVSDNPSIAPAETPMIRLRTVSVNSTSECPSPTRSFSPIIIKEVAQAKTKIEDSPSAATCTGTRIPKPNLAADAEVAAEVPPAAQRGPDKLVGLGSKVPCRAVLQKKFSVSRLVHERHLRQYGTIR